MLDESKCMTFLRKNWTLIHFILVLNILGESFGCSHWNIAAVIAAYDYFPLEIGDEHTGDGHTQDLFPQTSAALRSSRVLP